MFDIGFPELMIVSVIALLVIGPEKLPEAIRTMALWIGRIKRSLTNIKLELENEIGADEIRQQIYNESIMDELKETKAQLTDIMEDTDQAVTDIKQASTVTKAIADEPGQSKRG